MTPNEELKRAISAMRVGKLIYWARVRGEKLTPDIVHKLIISGIWRDGNTSLEHWLVDTLGLSHADAVDFTLEAINKKYVDENLYK